LSFKEIANMKTLIKDFIARILDSGEMESPMNNRLLHRLPPRAKRVACATALAIASVSAGATCVPNPESYGTSSVPFTVTTVHQPGQSVRYTSWATGSLTNFVVPFGNAIITTTWSGTASQLFSDRTYPCTPGPNQLCNTAALQPFDINSADSLGVSVDADDNVVLTLYSWGNGRQPFTATCNTTTNILYAFGHDELLAITFGSPVPDPQ
jgi:hypothetical protein